MTSARLLRTSTVRLSPSSRSSSRPRGRQRRFLRLPLQSAARRARLLVARRAVRLPARWLRWPVLQLPWRAVVRRTTPLLGVNASSSRAEPLALTWRGGSGSELVGIVSVAGVWLFLAAGSLLILLASALTASPPPILLLGAACSRGASAAALLGTEPTCARVWRVEVVPPSPGRHDCPSGGASPRPRSLPTLPPRNGRSRRVRCVVRQLWRLVRVTCWVVRRHRHKVLGVLRTTGLVGSVGAGGRVIVGVRTLGIQALPQLLPPRWKLSQGRRPRRSKSLRGPLLLASSTGAIRWLGRRRTLRGQWS